MKKMFMSIMLMLCPWVVMAQSTKPQRPKIQGIAHISLLTDDLQNASDLFTEYLGYGKPYIVERPGKPTMMFAKINDRQYVEFIKDDNKSLVKYRHTAFEVDDLEAMRLYLQAMGVVVPDKINDTGFGFNAFFVNDFNGNPVEFVQYTDKGTVAEHKGQDMPMSRISTSMRHVGWVCKDSAKDIAFYGYILGFTEFWRGGEDNSKINWIKMRLPDSKDYVELMLVDHELNQQELGLFNHLDLDVDDVQATVDLLRTRKLPEGCKPAEEQSKGVCGYGLSNIYLADQTRIELMTKIALGGKPSNSTWGVPLRYDGK